jgi:hypothetical protein
LRWENSDVALNDVSIGVHDPMDAQEFALPGRRGTRWWPTCGAVADPIAAEPSDREREISPRFLF